MDFDSFPAQTLTFQSLDEDDTLLSDFFSDPDLESEFLSEDKGYFSLRDSFRESLKDDLKSSLKDGNLNSSLNGLDSIRDTSLKDDTRVVQNGRTEFLPPVTVMKFIITVVLSVTVAMFGIYISNVLPDQGNLEALARHFYGFLAFQYI